MVKLNAPRRVRAALRREVVVGSKPLILVGPRHVGRAGWWYVTKDENDELVAITKHPVVTRDEGRAAEAVRRFGRRASVYQPRKQK